MRCVLAPRSICGTKGRSETGIRQSLKRKESESRAFVIHMFAVFKEIGD